MFSSTWISLAALCWVCCWCLRIFVLGRNFVVWHFSCRVKGLQPSVSALGSVGQMVGSISEPGVRNEHFSDMSTFTQTWIACRFADSLYCIKDDLYFFIGPWDQSWIPTAVFCHTSWKLRGRRRTLRSLTVVTVDPVRCVSAMSHVGLYKWVGNGPLEKVMERGEW